MDDALVVGGGQAVGDVGADLQDLAQRQRAAGEPLAQRLALEQLHDGVGDRLAEPVGVWPKS